MDMILGPFADHHLAELEHVDLDAYERLLSENDQDLYRWVSGQEPAPPDHAAILRRISATLPRA